MRSTVRRTFYFSYSNCTHARRQTSGTHARWLTAPTIIPIMYTHANTHTYANENVPSRIWVRSQRRSVQTHILCVVREWKLPSSSVDRIHIHHIAYNHVCVCVYSTLTYTNNSHTHAERATRICGPPQRTAQCLYTHIKRVYYLNLWRTHRYERQREREARRADDDDAVAVVYAVIRSNSSNVHNYNARGKTLAVCVVVVRRERVVFAYDEIHYC